VTILAYFNQWCLQEDLNKSLTFELWVQTVQNCNICAGAWPYLKFHVATLCNSYCSKFSGSVHFCWHFFWKNSLKSAFTYQKYRKTTYSYSELLQYYNLRKI